MKKQIIIRQIFLFTTLIALIVFITLNMTTPLKASNNVPAKSMIVMESSTNRVLTSHNAYVKAPMASTTKIMTAITAIEACNIDEVITIPRAACGVEGSSIYLEAGEKLSIRHLLYGLMLQSGNDCATAIALHVGKSIEGFSKMMNDKAQILEAFDTSFANPHGLDAPNHYTTAYDLALISCYAMKNQTFKEIVGTKRIKIPFSTREYDRVIVNKNKMLQNFDGATGIKTGFTKKAGRCLVTSAQRNGMELVCVVLNCGPMWETTAKYMNLMFEKYQMHTILKPYEFWGEVSVSNRKDKKIGCYSQEEFKYPIATGEESGITERLELPGIIKAPMKKNAEIGKIKYYRNNELIFSAKIYTINSIENMTFLEALEKIIAERELIK